MTSCSMEIKLKHLTYITSGSSDYPEAIYYFLLHYLLSQGDIQSFVSRFGKTLRSRLEYQINLRAYSTQAMHEDIVCFLSLLQGFSHLWLRPTQMLEKQIGCVLYFKIAFID